MNSPHQITGRVAGSISGTIIQGLRVEAWDKDLIIDDFLGSAVSDDHGRFVIDFKSNYYQELFTDRRPDIFFKVFNGDSLIADTCDQILWNVSNSNVEILITIDTSQLPKAVSAKGSIKGRIVSDKGLAVSNIRLVVFVKGITKDLRLGATSSDKSGNYLLHYSPRDLSGNLNPDIQIIVYKSNDEKIEIFRSAVSYNAGLKATIDVTIRAADVPRAVEYDRLLADIKPLTGKVGLHGLRENAQKENITLLSNKTGWDARMVAMAAQAEKLSKETGIDACQYYAMFRSGIQANASSLGKISPASLEKILLKAVKEKIIPEDSDIAGTLKKQAAIHATTLLKNPFPGAVSTLDNMLDLHLKAKDKITFTDCFTEAGGDMAKFWSLLPEKGIKPEVVAHLKVDGQMGYLTQHNAPLIRKLYGEYKISDPAQLVANGFYKASTWKEFIGNDVHQDMSAGDYAAGLATMIQLSYPTEVTAQMVLKDEVQNVPQKLKKEIHQFLTKSAGNNTLGISPIKQWKGYAALNTEVKSELNRVERLFQLSPSNEAMAVLSGSSCNSAFEIVKTKRSAFAKHYTSLSGNSEDAEKIYTKSHEVYSAALSLVTSYLTHRASPNVYGISGKSEKPNSEIVAAPTLEELFGNMDYCSCDHCKSVLSPAAYLVDLLQFIDLSGLSYEGKNPVEVLLGRRPDLQNIQLSCENTNTPLPYIDLVNEILEQYVLNGNLDNLLGHDISENTDPADLLADPAFVEESAYTLTKTKVYPYTLPFDMPLEAMRLIFKAFDSSLEEALGVFGNPLSARNAWLGLNPIEYQIFTDSSIHKLPEYFGEPGAATLDDLNCSVANAKIFCRRLDITNTGLVQILKSSFVNPGSILVPLLEKLSFDAEDLIAYYSGTITGLVLKAKLPAGFKESEYGGDVLIWLDSNKELISRLITLTDISNGTVECNFADVQLRHFLPDTAKIVPCQNGLDAIDYHRFHRYIRLSKKLGWKFDTINTILEIFLPISPDKLTEANIDGAFVVLLARIANLKRLIKELSISEKKMTLWLAIWDKSKTADLRTEALARILKIRTQDLLDISQITGIEPLADDMDAEDPSLMRFLKVFNDLKSIPVKVADLNYLLRSKDETGKLSLSDDMLLQNIKAIRDAINAVDADLGTASADTGLVYARMKLSMVYDSTVVDNFFSLLNNSKIYSASLVMLEEFLPNKLGEKDPNLGYDPLRKLLTYSGNLSDTGKTDLKTLTDALVLADMSTINSLSDLNALKTAIKNALEAVQLSGIKDLDDFAAAYPVLKTVYDTVKPISDPAGQSESLIKAIMPDLALRLKINALRQILSSQMKCEPLITQALTERSEVLAAGSNPAKNILYDFLELQTTPIFNANTAYDFYIDPPATDNYNIYVSAPSGTKVDKLIISGADVISAAVIGVSGEVQNVSTISLKAGVPIKVRLELSLMAAGQKAEILWRTNGMAKTAISPSRIFDLSAANIAEISTIKLQKAALLQKVFKFTPDEYSWFAGDHSETIHFLNELDTNGSITGPNLHALWQKIYHLVFFTQLKNHNEAEENSWLQVLKKPDIKAPDGKLLLAGIADWDEADIMVVINKLGHVLNDVSKLEFLKSLIPAMDFVYKVNYPVASVISWSTETPDYHLFNECKKLIKERTEGAAWLETMQSINDPLRNMRRDALVSYILYYKRPSDEINTADKLYEYYLIDVQMDACMMTSRIRAAMSTLQLFIQRCLMNLEPEVSADSINPQQWDWMKRYRVWEANRKVFLYPENWLEPELRDGKSSFFKELEGELLSADIDDELAETAFLNYLKKLDDVAKLEIIGTYLQEDPKGNQQDDILHVIGRTNGMTRQYYYRRYEFGYWTAWEKVTASIEGDHVFPVIWKSRLFLFWLNVMVKPAGPEPGSLTNLEGKDWSGSARKNVEINMCWAEYYKGKWASPKSSELSDPIRIDGLDFFNREKVILTARKEIVNKRERLIFNLNYLFAVGAMFKIVYTSKNSPPKVYTLAQDTFLAENVQHFLRDEILESYFNDSVEAYHNYNAFRIESNHLDLEITQPSLAESPVILENLITQNGNQFGGFRLFPTKHPVRNQWEAPLYYEDERSSFYIKPKELDTLAIWEYEDYYDIGIHDYTEYPIYVPPLQEEVIIPDLKGPVINPVDEFVNVMNPNIDKVLTSVMTFGFDEAVFDAGGKVGGKTNMNIQHQ
ncbi:MAG: neuraminidase-like domain-containing protein [Bacteroidota bacterium]